jgi:hypothetical protein
METILLIPRELKYFERLVKLVRRKKDAETIQAQVVIVICTPNIRRVCINKINHSKTLQSCGWNQSGFARGISWHKGVNVGHGYKCGFRV